jgi:hypothetical protein
MHKYYTICFTDAIRRVAGDGTGAPNLSVSADSGDS